MIYGKSIRLRAIEKEDLPHFVEWLNDPEVIEGLLVNLPFSLDDETRWFEKMTQGPPEKHVMGIEVHREEGWQLITPTLDHSCLPRD